MAIGRDSRHSRRITYVSTVYWNIQKWQLTGNSLLLLTLSLALLLYLPSQSPPHPLLRSLATFLGISATLLAILQYAPQIYKTYTAGLVGALSLGTMIIQVPGSVLFVLSLVFREGTDWTSWLAYAVTGGMQGTLLVSGSSRVQRLQRLNRRQIICLMWKRRQKALGVDDFGRPRDSGRETDALLGSSNSQ
jgi:uncharacterized protein with PQ loop repeat